MFSASNQNAARTMQTFNPFTTVPVEGVSYELGPNFGRPLSADDYQSARSFFFALGFRCDTARPRQSVQSAAVGV